MVKAGGELPVEAATISSPEWNFPAIARPRTKRVGTPFPEKARRALKRLDLEPGSEVSRAKKKILFAMAENLLTGIHGEGMESPEEGQFLAGGGLHDESMIGVDGLNEKVSGECNHREDAPEMVTTVDSPTVISNLEETKHTCTAHVLGDCMHLSSFGDYKHELLESKVVDYPNPLLDACTENDNSCACGILKEDKTNSQLVTCSKSLMGDGLASGTMHACDLPKEKKSNSTLHVHEVVAPIWEIDKNNSNCVPRASCHPLVNNVREVLVVGAKGDPAPDVRSPEHLPETSTPPENQHASEEGATATTSHRTIEPINLDAGKLKPMGTAGINEGIPSLSFSDKETEFLSEKIGLAIVGKFSLSLPSTHQIQRALGNIELVGSFTWKYLNAKHILLQFQDGADYAKVLNGPNGIPVWYIGVHPMRVFKWAPNFDTFFESPIVAVWCNIIGIPVHLYEESALMAVGKLLGKPIQADHATINQTRLSFARICVEIDISTPPTEEIILNILGKESRHKVAWDRIPLFCANCKHVGHVKDKCYASGSKEREGSMDHRTAATSHQTIHVSKTIRREWRPKATTRVGTSTSIEHTAKDKEGVTQEKSKGSTMAADSSAPKGSSGRQPSVDHDGFQLVSRKRKGKANEGGTYNKAQHIGNLHLKGNVATVLFGNGNAGVNEPGICSMSISCGPPNREAEGFIEELDPGGSVPSGGIPIAGLN